MKKLSNLNAVMNGEIDQFITAYLKSNQNKIIIRKSTFLTVIED